MLRDDHVWGWSYGSGDDWGYGSGWGSAKGDGFELEVRDA